MIKISDLVKSYKMQDLEVKALDKVSLEFRDNGIVFILGKSGCGKTTLLNVLSGLDNYSSGSITVNGNEINQLDSKKSDDYRNMDVGIIFQEYNLIPELTVYENIVLAAKIQKREDGLPIREEITKILKFIELEEYQDRKISELSGGQKQRIAIARALIKRPKIILADEPTGNLDSNTGKKVITLLKEISKQCLVIIVSHDASTAFEYGDVVIRMKDGKICDIVEKNHNVYYSIQCVDKMNSSEKILTELNRSELQDNLNNILNQCDNIEQIEIAITAKVKICTELIEKKDEKLPEEKRVLPLKMSVKDKLKFCLLFIKKKKFRLFISIILLAIATFLFTFTSYITFYDESSVMMDYLNKYQPTFLIPEKQVSYVNSFYDEKKAINSYGKKYKEIISAYNEGKDLYGLKTGETLTSIKNEQEKCYGEVTIVFQKNNKNMYKLSEGNWPTLPNDMVVTDFISKQLNLSLGSKVIYRDIEFEVSGITETDYIAYGLERKMLFGSSSEYLQYLYSFYYNVAITNENSINVLQNKNVPIYLKLSNFTLGKVESKFVESNENISYGVLQEMKLPNIVSGRIPNKENEVMVSEEFAQKYGTLSEGNFIDIENEKYNGYYDDNINLNNFFPKGISIVGVFTADNEYNFEVIINNNVYQKIKKEYYYNYFFNSYAISCNTKNYSEILDLLKTKGYDINEPAAKQIHSFSKTLLDILPILYILLIAILILAVFMIVNYITISIRENNKNIGILRAIGVRNQDVTSIFMYETLVVFGVAFILSMGGVFTFLSYINIVFQRSLKERVYNIINGNVLATIMVTVIVLVTCLVSVLIPIYRLSKLKPVEIIRND